MEAIHPSWVEHAIYNFFIGREEMIGVMAVDCQGPADLHELSALIQGAGEMIFVGLSDSSEG